MVEVQKKASFRRARIAAPHPRAECEKTPLECAQTYINGATLLAASPEAYDIWHQPARALASRPHRR